jgi:hypothetical protein
MQACWSRFWHNLLHYRYVCTYIYILLYIYIHSHCLDMSGLEFAYLAQPSRAVHFNLRNNKCVWSLSRDVHIFQSNGGHWRPSPWPSKSLQRPGGIISAQSWLQFNIASSFHLRSRDPPRPGGKGRGSRSPHDSRHETCGKRVGNVWETCGKRVGNLQNSSFGMPRHRAARSSGSAHCLVQSSHPEMWKSCAAPVL